LEIARLKAKALIPFIRTQGNILFLLFLLNNMATDLDRTHFKEENNCAAIKEKYQNAKNSL